MTNTMTRLLALVLLVVFAAAPPALAQRRVPHTQSSAFGGEVGAFVPSQSGMTTGPAIEGFYEHYLTARDSVRLGVGWANPKVEREHSDSMQQIRLGGDLVHNWEGGAVHPFVGAGLGAYFLQPRDNGNDAGPNRTKLGGTIFGGVEFFTSRTFAVKGEARYHAVMKSDGYNPSGLSLSIGIKSYF
jgi:Outer membrane protein beta-barrel domain